MKKLFTTLVMLGGCFSGFSQKLDTVYRNAGYGQMEHIGLFKESNGDLIMAGSYAGSIDDVDPGASTIALPAANSFGFYLIKYSSSGTYVKHLSVQSTANIIAQDAARDASGNYYIVGDINGTADFDPSASVVNVSSGTANRKAFIAKYDQNFNFLSVNTFSSTNYSSFESIKIDASGKIYLGGYFWGTQDFDFGAGVANETSATTGSNMFVMYDSNMNLLNRFVNFGRFRTLCDVDNSGNIYLAGTFDSNVDFDPSVSTYTLNPSGGSDIYIAKYNSSMALQWVGQIGNANSESLKQLKLDVFGNPILVGKFSGTVDFDINSTSSYTLSAVSTDEFLVRISSAGIFNWARYYQLSNLSINAYGDYVTIDSNNDIYYTGAFNGTKNFNNGGVAYNMVATGDVDGFVEKLDNLGTQQWCFRFGGSTPGFNYTGGHCISVENSGQMDLIGSMRVVNDFDPSPYDSTSTPSYGSFYNSYVAKYNQLKTLSVSSTSVCSGNSLTVPYTINGICNSGNIFTAQLSDAAGSFVSPVSIGTISATSSGTISATIPSTVAYGTNYRIRVIASNPSQKGERSNSNILINKAPSVLSQPTNKTACINANTSFTSSVSSNTTSLQWYFNSSPITTATTTILSLTSVQPANSGNYYLTATNSCGSTNSNTVVLTVNDPTVSVSGIMTLCAGQSTTLTASGAVNYSWNTGANSSTIAATPSANVNYTVTGIDAQGCVDTETLTIVLNQLPNVSAATSNSIICTGETATLTASGANTYTWNASFTGSVITVTPSSTAIYTVTGTDANGCSNSSVVTQSVSLCTGLSQLQDNSSIAVYPNPFANVITVKTVSENNYMLIVDLLGKTVYEKESSSTETRIDLSDLDAGIYHLIVSSNAKVFSQKIVKQ
ncbi:MAG: T9SS type A sorting domain-containing protein [Bacteroidetes bacterium]|nr:T9SS type A sorting domain-containing protein [Bacteroidota bacterium]